MFYFCASCSCSNLSTLFCVFFERPDLFARPIWPPNHAGAANTPDVAATPASTSRPTANRSALKTRTLIECNASFVSSDEMRTITASPKSNLSFKEKVALQGKPRLGEIRKVQVRIKESKEFKVSIANLIWGEHLGQAQAAERSCEKISRF